MQTILKRKKFLAETPDLIPVRETLTRAKQVLGYKPSALALEDSRVGAEQLERKVAGVLESLGIEPLDRALVKKYQQEEVRKVERRGASRFVKEMHGEVGRHIVVIGAFLWIGVLSLTLGWLLAAAPDKGPLPPGMAQHFLSALRVDLVLFAGWTILMIARHKRAEVYLGSWPMMPVSQYSEPIPEFALERAMQIKSQLPDAQFGIEYIRQQTQQVSQPRALQIDPFLVLLYGHMKLYLDVWDEPRFEGRRTI